MRNTWKYLLHLTFLLLGTNLALADPQESARTPKSPPTPILFLQNHDANIKKILSEAPGDTLSAQLRVRIKKDINAVFDFAELSRLALGDHWEARSEKEKTYFVETFSGIIEEQNFDSFVRYYREGKIDYQEEEVEGNKASVRAQVPLKREQIEIEYSLHIVDAQWRVYDLVIDGVSTAEGNRRRYARFIEKHSYEKLVERLDKQLTRLRESND